MPSFSSIERANAVLRCHLASFAQRSTEYNDMKNCMPIFLVLCFLASFTTSLILSKDGEAYPQRYGVPPSMLPPLASGRVLKLFTSPNSGLFGGTIWPATFSLCTFLLENQQALKLQSGNCVVELGSGTGAVGLFAARLGAKVILTDCRPPPDSAMYTTDGTSLLPVDGSGAILKLLERNVEANMDMFSVVPKVLELDWTSSSHVDHVLSTAGGDCNVVLASDVTHFSLMHEPLASTIARLLHGGGGICLLSHQERIVNLKGQDMQLHDFIQVARSSGLHVERLPSAVSPTITRQTQRSNDGTQSDSRISMLLMRHMDSVSSPLHGTQQ